MARNMKVISSITSVVDKDDFSGVMEANMMVPGNVTNSTEMVSLSSRMVQEKLVCGSTENILNGTIFIVDMKRPINEFNFSIFD